MMNQNSNNFFSPILLSITLTAGVIIGLVLSPNGGSVNFGANDYAKKLLDIFDVIERNYVDSIDKEDLIEETISEMLHKLDPHSNYIPAAELARMQESVQGSFDGIGVRFAIIQDTLNITNVVEKSPSEKAGLLVFDQIIGVEGDTITNINLSNTQVQKLLKGPSGTEVRLTIKRKDQILEIPIKRGPIPIKSISAAHMVDDKVGYIRLDQFSMYSDKEFLEAGLKLRNQGMQKLIFDLRFNTGGVMGAAINIVDAFLKPGLPIVSTKSKGKEEMIEFSRNSPVFADVDLVILINQSSASASEIVAGAIQDNDRGIIVGRRSFGKGLVQQDIGLKDGSNLRLTTSRYYTPTGRSIQKPYNGDYEDYLMDEINRFESGELYEVDSTWFVDSLKYLTPQGKAVYGGGGIMPDIFIPLDTSNNSIYYRHLQYASAFSNFAYEYIRYHKLPKFINLEDFDKKFIIDDRILIDFIDYSNDRLNVKNDMAGFENSKSRIKNDLKGEFARHYFLENGLFYIRNQMDKEFLKAFSIIKEL